MSKKKKKRLKHSNLKRVSAYLNLSGIWIFQKFLPETVRITVQFLRNFFSLSVFLNCYFILEYSWIINDMLVKGEQQRNSVIPIELAILFQIQSPTDGHELFLIFSYVKHCTCITSCKFRYVCRINFHL